MNNIKYNLNSVENFEKIYNNLIEGPNVIGLIYTQYNFMNEQHYKALKDMQTDYLNESDDYDDFEEYKDNNETLYDGYIFDKSNVYLNLSNCFENLPLMLSSLDVANDLLGNVDSSEFIISQISKNFISEIKKDINISEVHETLIDLFNNYLILYLLDGSDSKLIDYKRMYNNTFDNISDLLDVEI